MRVATFTLPLTSVHCGLDPALPLDAPEAPPRQTLPQVQWVERQGSLLQPCPIPGEGEVLSLNLTRGCAHRCGFCSARGYPTFPRDHALYAFADSTEHLDAELSRWSRPPRAVFLSPATDP